MAYPPTGHAPLSGSRRRGHQSSSGPICADDGFRQNAARMAAVGKASRGCGGTRTEPQMNTLLSNKPRYRAQLHHPITRPFERAYMILEALMYIGISVLLLSIGTVAMYRCMDN